MDFDLKEYVKKAQRVFGSKYEYVGYKRNNGVRQSINVAIYCHEKDKYGREHGVFWKDASKHLNGKQGCPKCSGRFHMDTNYLIETSKLAHTSEFDNLTYEKTKFKNHNTKVTVTCHNKDENGIEHGDFQIAPNHLLNGQGCPKCRYLKSAASKRRTLDEAIALAKKAHGDKYDYSLITEYKNDRTPYPIVCPKHGVFEQTFNNHVYWKEGCPKCAVEKNAEIRKMTNKEFAEKGNLRHNNFYDYSKVDLENRNEEGKVCIICPKHREFWQLPTNHLYGQGCPICKQSRMENEIGQILKENNIEYIQQQTFDWLKRRRNLHLDFYLPQYNVAIECQGIQHFENEHFGGHSDNDVLTDIQALDGLKRQLCEEHGINMLYYANYEYDFPYEVETNKEKLIEIIINSKER